MGVISEDLQHDHKAGVLSVGVGVRQSTGVVGLGVGVRSSITTDFVPRSTSIAFERKSIASTRRKAAFPVNKERRIAPHI